MPIPKSIPGELSMELLHRKGWTLRTAAERLGVHWTHLHKVIKGQRTSEKLTTRIHRLPERRKTPAAH